MLGFDRILYLYDFIRPFLDIAVMTFILFKAYDFISKTNGVQMLKSLLIVVIVYGVAVLLKLQTILWLMNIIAPAIIIGFALVFQPEIRKLFIRIGQNGWFAFGSRSKHTYVDAVLIAAEMLSQQKRGMLAVFMRHTQLENLIQINWIADSQKESVASLGRLGNYGRYQLVEIPQRFARNDVTQYMYDDNVLFFFASGDNKMIDMVDVGETLIDEITERGEANGRIDDIMKYEIQRELGVNTHPGRWFGQWTITE